MSTASSLLAVSPARSTGSARTEPRSRLLSVTLLAGSALVAFLVSRLTGPSAYTGAEPDLVFLLRSMAAIKAAITLPAVGLAWWRFQRPVSAWAASGYVAGVWSLVGANVCIWYLSSLLAAGAVYHAALFGLLALAWRDGRSRSVRRAA